MASVNQSVYTAKKYYAWDEITNTYLEVKPWEIILSATGTSTENMKYLTLNGHEYALGYKVDSAMSSTSENPVQNKVIIDFVNSSIEAWAAFYLTKNADGDQFNTRSELMNATEFYYAGKIHIPSNNDYTIVTSDELHDNNSTRYAFVSDTEGNGQWQYQYTYNYQFTQAQWNSINSGVTADKLITYDNYEQSKQAKLNEDQVNAVNSGITAAKVNSYDAYASNKQDKLTAGTGISIVNGVISCAFQDKTYVQY